MAPVKPAVGVIDTLLRGVGQVMFQNNPITGLLFLVGIFINSYNYGLTALLGLVVATLAAYLLGADRTLIRNGLFGFNGVLTGIALSVFLQWDWHVAVYIILGAIVSTIVMMGLAKLLISWDGCSCCRRPVSKHCSGSRSPSAPRQAPWSGCAPRS